MKNDLSAWKKKLEKRAAARAKKIRPRMRVSGAGVKKLERIIRGK
jgi:hypothetical protein